MSQRSCGRSVMGVRTNQRVNDAASLDSETEDYRWIILFFKKIIGKLARILRRLDALSDGFRN